MRNNRFYLEQPIAESAILELSGAAAHHLSRVLRARVGTELQVFNDQGSEHQATVRTITRRQVVIKIGAAIDAVTESALHIHLVQSVSRGERMDLVMQKATELGVHRISPVLSRRSVVRLDAERAANRLEHWRRIVISATEQSGRRRLPQLEGVQSLDQLLQQDFDDVCRLFLDTRVQTPLSASPPPPANKVLIVVGPEGGMDSGERDLLGQHGFMGLSLGPRILRTETAAIAGIAMIQSLWGDM